jgi:hypothetical protein
MCLPSCVDDEMCSSLSHVHAQSQPLCKGLSHIEINVE